ncbi:MAG: response regulator [Spirochaetaceae bacterium]|jgi:signal transduction histidine kinase|nr:response regulator [Spirochaetaceae bacterium]
MEQNNISAVFPDAYSLAALSISLLLAFLYFLQFLFNRSEKHNLYFAVFTFLCGLYRITKISFVSGVISGGGRAGFFLQCIIPAVFVFFLEKFLSGKIRRVSLVYFFISLCVAIIRIPPSLSVQAVAEQLWLVCTVLMAVYVLLADVFVPFGAEIKAIAQKKETKYDLAAREFFRKLPAGYFILASAVLLVCFCIDLVLAGFFSVATYYAQGAYLVFTVVSACSLVYSNSIAVRKIKYANVEQAGYLDLVLNSSPDMIVLLNSELKIVKCAAAFLNKLPGYTLDDLLDTDYRAIFSSFLKEDVLETLSIMFDKALLQKKSISIFESIDFLGGDMKQYEMHFTPMFGENGSLEGALLFLSDMTAILAAVQKAEDANRAKTSFLATMSHEIRTPLNAILGLSEILLLNELPGKTRIDIEKIYLSGSNLLQIINDILDISKIETEKFVIEVDHYRLGEAVNDCIQFNIIRISEKPIQFSLEINENIPVNLFGDELRIKQIINNILSNAFKYTKRGNVVLIIDYEKIDEKNITLLIGVRDTGIGIRQENIGSLFGDYTRFGQNENKFIEGTGLGLSITKKLVDMMGGTITVESAYGKGSVFRVKLPQAVMNNVPLGGETADKLKSLHYFGQKQKKQITRKNFAGKKLLIVDDVPMNIDVAKGLISLYGIEVHGVSSGKTAIELIRSLNVCYDLIIMDHMMPEMSGVEAARIIRNQIGSDYARSVPIIAFTANAIQENMEIFFANGFNGYLTKPMDVYELDDLLNKFLLEDSEGEVFGLEEILEVFEPEADMAVPCPDLPMLDMKTAVLNYGDMNTFLAILKKSIQNLPAMLEEIKNPAPETLKDYEIKVHGLKGAIYGLYYAEGGNLAAELEKYARTGDIDAVLERNHFFIATMNGFIETLKEMQKEKLNAADARADTEKDAELRDKPDENLLLSLRKAAEEYRTTEMAEIMRSLEKHRYREGTGLLLWLREKVEMLEYHDIVEKLLSLERING